MISLVACALLTLAPAAPSLPGREVVRAMHDRYAGTWYRTLTFVQKNTATAPDGHTDHSVWREYAAINRYQPVGAAWLAAEVAFLVDGQQRWLEEYIEIATGAPIADALFDPRQWPKAKD
jgi:hypothetical protein